jgi:hypothetical protein
LVASPGEQLAFQAFVHDVQNQVSGFSSTLVIRIFAGAFFDEALVAISANNEIVSAKFEINPRMSKDAATITSDAMAFYDCDFGL